MALLKDHNAYLGIPFTLTRRQTHLFQPLLQKVNLKVDAWKKYLSKAGKLIMIKSILQAIPLHLMSCIKLPQGVCLNLEKAIRKFFWGVGGRRGCQRDKKIHWVGWDILCQRKVEGGLGLRRIGLFNQSLLAKQGWNLFINPNSLLARLYKELYHPNSTFLEATVGRRSSPYWKGLLWGRILLFKGMGWRIRSGEYPER